MTPVQYPFVLVAAALVLVAGCMLFFRVPPTRPLARRLVEYAPLALSSIALLAAGYPFYHPTLLAGLTPLPGLILAGALVQGRWVMPAWAANLLGVVVAAGGAAWVAWHVYGPAAPASVPLPTGLVPHLGPILLALLAVKLYRRPEGADFWLFQGMGLLQVGLACALTADLLFGALLLAYLAALLTALAVRHAAAVGAPAASALRSLAWAVLVGAAALACFLLTPRPGASWDPHVRFEGRPTVIPDAGGPGDLDLNGTGPVQLTHDVAFTVTATWPDGSPMNDLPGDQRWRGQVLDAYQAGRWSMVLRPREVVGTRLPDFGPGQFYLDFKLLRRRAGPPVAAEPVRLGDGEARVPVVSLEGRRSSPFFESGGTLLGNPFAMRDVFRYRQVVPGGADRDRTPAQGLFAGYVRALRTPPPPPLPEWTTGLLARLAEDPRYGLEQGDLGPPPPMGPEPSRDARPAVPANAERVARALTRYLAESGEYAYTLERPRQDQETDPTADFLINVKAGHCERFAAALALMLRARGVPCRVVTGYRGAVRTDDGAYAVLQNDAHAWVEALVPRPDADGEFDWLTLDPTPGGGGDEGAGFSLWTWLHDRWGLGLGALWRDLVVNYGGDRQSELWDSLQPALPGRGAVLGWGGGLAAAAVAAVWLRRRLRRPARRGGGLLPAYDRLLALLERHGRPPPGPGQTPREHAEAAAADLGTDVPPRVVALYYRVRFGGGTPTPEETRALDEALDGLEAALRDERRGVNPPKEPPRPPF
jgi:protein-glutamine gamma-glutamyltransferase